MTEYVKTTVKENYAVIEFFHPSHNSLHSGLLRQLQESIIAQEANDNVKVILLKSGGNRTFCAGANFDEMKAIKNEKEGESFFSGFGNVIKAMKSGTKIIVGRIQGKAVGGGVGLVSACDIAFATKYAAIRLSELSIGIGPFVIEPAVKRKLGLSGMTELTLHPLEWKDASWCYEKGLYSRVFDSTDLLDEYVDKYIVQLASYNHDALKEIKKMLWHGTGHWDKLMHERALVSGKLVLGAKFGD